jgi:clan AA aspartic protease (TIGR02281 family)
VNEYRLRNDRLAQERRRNRSVVPLIFAGLLVLAGIAVVIVRPEVIPLLSRFVTGPRSASAPRDQDDTQFTSLYARYDIRPLAAAIVANDKVNTGLTRLLQEPCARHAIFEASVGLENAGGMREAARLLRGFSAACPDSEGELYRSAELYYLAGDQDAAIEQANAFVRLRPDSTNIFYLRGRAFQAEKRYEEALADYATAVRLAPDLKLVVAEVFMRMSATYEALDRNCEAMMPIQLYIAAGGDARSTPALRNRLGELSRKGGCAATFARGTTIIPRPLSGVIHARAAINGVEGNFIVDTGASFVTLSRAFAEKVKATPIATGAIKLQTANGAVSSPLATAATIVLGSVSASTVPLVVVEKPAGDGVDGLLGMSFLSRFDLIMTSKQIELRAKPDD